MMAKKKASAERDMEDLTEYTQPDWPTAKRGLLSGGRVLGIDGSMWVYRSVPLEPVTDAKTAEDSLKPGDPLIAAFEELAAMVPIRITRRKTARTNYRQVHLLLVNVPAAYHLPHDQPGSAFLNSEFADQETQNRLLLFGVRLMPSIGSGGLRSAVDSIYETIRTKATPLEDFDRDYARVDAALNRSGLRTPSDQDFTLADSWWSTRRNPATTFVEHPGHTHVFNSLDSARAADAAGAEDCSNWPKIDGQYVMTLAAVQEFELPFRPATSPGSRWVDTMRAQGAVAVSIRGLVEPAKVTRAELRRRRKQYLEDVQERYSAGKLDRAEQDRTLHELTAVEKVYSSAGAPPTLVESTVTLALNGAHQDLYQSSAQRVYTLTEMANRQLKAMSEMWIASPVRSNPHQHDLPCHTIAYSGLPSLAVVGDDWGAQVGVTQSDRQPAFLSHIAASRGDGLPLCLVTGQTGSGKTVTMLWLAHQFTKMMGVNALANPASGDVDASLKAVGPQLIVDPKIDSDHTAAVRASGGQVASLDSVISADGVADPMRQFDNPMDSVDAVAAMLTAVNPWGSKVEDAYVPITTALKIGIDLGGRCTGAALKLANDKGELLEAEKGYIKKVLQLADTSPLFRASVGYDNEAPGMRTLEGITLIKVGRSPLNLPPANLARGEMTPPQRAALNLIRQVTLGAMYAMAGRDGVLHLDEGWIYMKGGASEMDEIGRVARSTRVLPIVYSQTVKDALNAGLRGYISRQIILPMTDVDEAKAAFELSRLEATPERLEAVTAEDMSGAAPNWKSHRALRDPVTRKVLRGTIGIYCDLRDRAIPVEILIPDWFLRKASTNAADIDRREKEAAEIDLVDNGSVSYAKGA